MSSRFVSVRGFVLCVIMILICMTSIARGTPMTWGTLKNGDPVPALKWPANSTINIFIAADPDTNPPDRAALLREGMLRWQAEMASRGITINVTVGDPPNPPPAGTIPCVWEAGGTGTNLGNNDGRGSCTSNSNDELNGGKIIIRSDLPDSTTADEDYIRNLGQHEITHVLGLADDSNGTVTNHTQYEDPNTYNDTDRKEISQLYPVLPDGEPVGQGATQTNLDPNQHDWEFTYSGPPDGHVALITMDVPAELIEQIITPPGWIVLDPSDPEHKNLDYPYYIEYMETCENDRPPWDGDFVAPLAFRAMNETETLSMINPVIHITLFTHGASRGSMRAWAGGPEQFLEGPVAVTATPVMSSKGLIFIALFFVVGGVLILRRRFSTGNI